MNTNNSIRILVAEDDYFVSEENVVHPVAVKQL